MNKLIPIVKIAGILLPTVTAVSMSLGHGNGGSSVNISCADNGNLANALIEHTTSNGGIRPVPGDSPLTPAPSPGIQASVDTSGIAPKGKQPPSEQIGIHVGVSPYGHILAKDPEAATVLECLRLGITQPHQIAFVLAVFKGETHWRDTVNTTDVFGRTPWRGRGLAQITSKGSYERVSKATGVDAISNPEIIRQRPDVNLAASVSSVRSGTRGRPGWGIYTQMPSPNSDRRNAYVKIQGGVWRNDYEKYYQEYLRSLPTIMARAKAIENGTPAAPVTPATNTPIAPVQVPKTVASATDDGSEIPKGSLIEVTWGDGNVFSFWHTSTSHVKSQGNTTITGQGLRWVLNRRNRNASINEGTLRDIAERICKASGFTLQYRASFNPSFSKLEQKVITDYKLLTKMVEQVGLFIYEKDKQVFITDIRASVQGGINFVVTPENCIDMQVQDIALTSANVLPDLGSSFQQDETKMILDLQTGKMVPKRKEVAPSTGQTSPSVSGKPADVNIKVAPQSEIQAAVSQSRTRRVAGMPTNVTLPLTDETLKLTPMSVVRSDGFPEKMFNRVWLLTGISHTSNGTSVLNLVSPVEVLDNVSTAIGSPGMQPTPTNGVQPVVNANGWGNPMRGFTVGSDFGVWRPSSGRHHMGVDVPAPAGTPIYAMGDGVVTVNQFNGGGYGWWVEISHGNGVSTRYGHFNVRSPMTVGTRVTRGQQIATVGTTGSSTGNHLHYEFRENGKAVNPNRYGIPSRRGERLP